MIRFLAKFLAILIFLAMLFTVLVYLWGSSKSVRFEKAASTTTEG
jgi:NADH:ubiquinone oxidoreductase subunit 3 (subunit A)